MGEVERFVRKKRYDSKPVVPDRYMALIEGKISVEELDDDEIFRMQLKNSKGQFSGRPPRAIPRELAMAMQREQQRRFSQDMTEMVEDARRAMSEILNNRHPLPGDAARLKAAQYVIDRFAGKTPERVEVKATVKVWEDVADEILVDVEDGDDEEDVL